MPVRHRDPMCDDCGTRHVGGCWDHLASLLAELQAALEKVPELDTGNLVNLIASEVEDDG